MLRLKVHFKSTRGSPVCKRPPSAVRLYEKECLLPKPLVFEGIEFAKQSGFRLEEIRRLLHGSPERVSLRWQALVRDKLDELKVQQERIAAMRIFLERAAKCRCLDIAECGRLLLKAKSKGRPSSRYSLS